MLKTAFQNLQGFLSNISKKTGDPQVAANLAVLDGFCRRLREQGVTVHLWHRLFRSLTAPQARSLIDSIPEMKAAINLNADPNIAKGVKWAGDKLGMIVLSGGTKALEQRNSILTSSKAETLMYAPLSLSSTPLAGLPENVPWVLDGDYRSVEEVQSDLRIIEQIVESR